MPLSLNKLCSMINKKDYIPVKYYSYENNCIFIELVSLSIGVPFLMYIPSRFEIPINKGENVIELDIVDEENADDYVENKYKVENTYEEIVLDTIDETDTEKQLLNKYKKNIDLKLEIKKSNIILKSVMRQLYRLYYCVKDLKYDLAISKDKYLCYIRDNEIDSYFKLKTKDKITIMRVVITLPQFYEKDILINEIDTVYKGIYKILDNNNNNQVSYLENLIKKKGNLLEFSKIINDKKKNFKTLIGQYRELLETMDTKHKTLKSTINELEETEGSGLNVDLKKSHTKTQLTSQINHCLSVKKNIIDNLLNLQNGLENISVNCDIILFDNSIMFDKMFKNFENLIKIVNQ